MAGGLVIRNGRPTERTGPLDTESPCHLSAGASVRPRTAAGSIRPAAVMATLSSPGLIARVAAIPSFIDNAGARPDRTPRSATPDPFQETVHE